MAVVVGWFSVKILHFDGVCVLSKSGFQSASRFQNIFVYTILF